MPVTAHIPHYDPCEVCSPRHCCGAVDCKAERGVPPRACSVIHHTPCTVACSQAARSGHARCCHLSEEGWAGGREGGRTGNECLASGLSIDPSMQALAFPVHSRTLGQLRVGAVKQRMRPGQIPLPTTPVTSCKHGRESAGASTSFWHVCCACLVANQSVGPSISWPPTCSLPSPVAR